MLVGLPTLDVLLLFGAGLLAAAANAVAGGGTFLTFPAFLATSVPAVTANASNAVAIWPGRLLVIAAYRDELLRHVDIQELNALKNLLVTLITGVAVAIFVVSGAVSWPGTVVMMTSALIGGNVGGMLARRVPAPVLRITVIAFGFALSAYYF